MCFVANRTVGGAFHSVGSESQLYRQLRLAAHAPLRSKLGFKDAYEHAAKLLEMDDRACTAFVRNITSARSFQNTLINPFFAPCRAVLVQGQVFPPGI